MPRALAYTSAFSNNSSSMLNSFGHNGRSTHVEMHLLLDGLSLPVAQLGPDFLFLKTPLDHPPGEGTLVVRADENERRWPVRLPEGLSAGRERVVITKV